MIKPKKILETAIKIWKDPVWSKVISAGIILLIASILNKDKVYEFAKFARSIGLEVLLEVVNQNEIETCLNEFIDIVGVKILHQVIYTKFII